MLTVSIVLFKTDIMQLIRCINCINQFNVNVIFIIDNSPTNELKKIAYIYSNINLKYLKF